MNLKKLFPNGIFSYNKKDRPSRQAETITIATKGSKFYISYDDIAVGDMSGRKFQRISKVEAISKIAKASRTFVFVQKKTTATLFTYYNL